MVASDPHGNEAEVANLVLWQGVRGLRQRKTEEKNRQTDQNEGQLDEKGPVAGFGRA
jgi:hypothetical protein